MQEEEQEAVKIPSTMEFSTRSPAYKAEILEAGNAPRETFVTAEEFWSVLDV